MPICEKTLADLKIMAPKWDEREKDSTQYSKAHITYSNSKML